MATGADVVVSPLIGALLDKLDSGVLNDFGLKWGVAKELTDLSKALQVISEMASVAEIQIEDACLDIFLRDVVYKGTYTPEEFMYEAHRQILEDESTTKRKVRREYIYFTFNDKEKLYRDEIKTTVTTLIKELVEIEEKIKPNYLKLINSKKWRVDETRRKLQVLSLLDKRPTTVSFVDENVHYLSSDRWSEWRRNYINTRTTSQR
uniref:Rx N-terminal domain-containing protein n=1 Tax=Nelumbo nucifera TaxID=4432 RepID=A0A822YSJ4_NELNU|nr:TPA_asm: hypothetical protein HUJ06_011049 [Nelumbo nucifera]